MLQFKIQSDSDIPASKQLFDQIRFAIASRQYPPGHRLPSTRQLATMTGLHRNTISKVYQQLEEAGLVESIAGSGIYVKAQNNEDISFPESPLFTQYPQESQLVYKSLDELLRQGLTLTQAKELFLAVIDWRLRCSAQVIVTVPSRDMGAGELILQELEKALAIPVELVSIEELDQVLAQKESATVVTSRYFIPEAELIASPHATRVFPIDIYDYGKELAMIKELPKDTRLGIVSLSPGIIRVAEILIHSLRGDDLLLITAPASDRRQLLTLARSAQTIMSDPASYELVKEAILTVRDDLIRPPDIFCSEYYIGEKSINLLKRELGLG
ncbi:GntR family transcriptional regulator [Cyanothece sp. BG0011]|uniref:GntR family transcriptional regulator n=1 Tax=Cyanothece sp. BG0011 TaxID=2082950 RepID=UPI000D1D7BCC|nr:GntR family transcriptional regulator [Cyanothece sp. BG0011]